MLDLCSQLVTLIIAARCDQKLSASIATRYDQPGFVERSSETKDQSPRYPLTNLAVLGNAFQQRTSNIQVLVLGRVVSVLPDDTSGDRHQRFIVQLANSQTVLIAHNVDIAARVSNLSVGDQLYIYGEYEWNSQGGVIHWTHHDPARRHIDGWIDKNGVVFR